MERSKPDWSELYPEILAIIAGRLEIREDLQNFRAVCKKWRISSSNSSKTLQTLPLINPMLPWKFLADRDFKHDLQRYLSSKFYPFADIHPFSLVANAVYKLRSRNNNHGNYSWLVTVEEFNRGKFFVQLPLTRTKIPINYFQERILNLSNFDVSVVARGYNVRIPEADQSNNLFNNKVVLISNPTSRTGDYWSLMTLRHEGRIGWSRFRAGCCFDFGLVFNKRVTEFDDIVDVKLKECVYVINRKGKLYSVPYHRLFIKKYLEFDELLKTERVGSGFICRGCVTQRRNRMVVDSSGVLYVVHACVYSRERVRFKVYKLDERRAKIKWEEVSSIGVNRVLFVGVEWCFFVSASDVPGCRGNCIFFRKNCFPTYNGAYSDESFFQGSSKELEVGVFHLKGGDARLISAYPGYSDILWPPPAWVCNNIS